MGTELESSAIDVTALVARLAPVLLQKWGPARIFLVAEPPDAQHAPRPTPHGPVDATPDTDRQPPCGGLAPATLRRVRQYIDEHLADTVTLRDLSTVAGLSDCHFSRAFKLTVGIPPLRFVMTRRIIEATALLLQTDRRISDISQDVGFADQSHFTRCFVAIMRQTPRSLRRNSR